MSSKLRRTISVAGMWTVSMAVTSLSWSVLAQEEEEQATGDDSVIEVVIVTAQRVTENLQDVPIAVSAFNSDHMEDRQIITPSDLQLNMPSMTYTATNFGGQSVSIRGIGTLVTGSSAEPGVSVHLDEISMPSNLNATEFFDMERVEVLRGPQGTLFGRNATGGAMNFVTNKPDLENMYAGMNFEAGSAQHTRINAIWNLPVSDTVGFRIAGYKLDRLGYTKNLAYGQQSLSGDTIPGIKEYLDGRDSAAMRLSFKWDVTDRLSIGLMHATLREDSDRARITNQVCKRNSLPNTGCDPNAFGLESVHQTATTAGLFTGLIGAIPLGTAGADPTQYDFPRPRMSGLREIHTDFQPIFEYSDDVSTFSVNYEFDYGHLSVIGAHSKISYLSSQDYSMDVGIRFHDAEVFVPPQLLPAFQYNRWPTSAPTGTAGEDWGGGRCDILSGTAGIFGGCMWRDAHNRMFAYDQSDVKGSYHVYEIKYRTQLDGPINGLVGYFRSGEERNTDYYVMANGLDMVGLLGVPSAGLPPLYPSYFVNSSDPAAGIDNTAAAMFGELYFDASDDVRFTVGLRHNQDDKNRSDSSVLFNSQNHVPIATVSVPSALQAIFAAALGVPPELIPPAVAVQQAIALGFLDADYLANINAASGIYWSRTLNILLGPLASGAPETVLAMHYGVTQEQLAAAMATPAYSAARVAISNMVPVAPTFGESRALTNSPDSASFSEISGRVGVEWQMNPETMVYGFFSQGYKPGGLNSAIPVDFQDVSSFTYEPETIAAVEGGTKSSLRGGRLILNTAAFAYSYEGLQVTRIKNNSAINENVDADMMGFEAEGWWAPSNRPNWLYDFSLSLLRTEVGDVMSLDPINRTAGQGGWVLLNNIDPGATTGINYIARVEDFTAESVAAAIAGGAAIPVAFHAPTASGVSIPVLFSRAFLTAQGVDVRDGIPTDISGNSLPNSPNMAFKVGAAYTSPRVGWGGNFTYRVDYMWQGETYSREFNTPGDEMEAWDQLNMSVIYESVNTPLQIKFWVRNVFDQENVTGMYLTSDTSGLFRNYFLTEPRIWGLGVSYTLGDE